MGGADLSPIDIDALLTSDMPHDDAHQDLPDRKWEVAGVTNEHTQFSFCAPIWTIVKYDLYSMQDVLDYDTNVKNGEVPEGLQKEIFAEDWTAVTAIFDKARPLLSETWSLTQTKCNSTVWGDCLNPSHSSAYKMRLAEKLTTREDFI